MVDQRTEFGQSNPNANPRQQRVGRNHLIAPHGIIEYAEDRAAYGVFRAAATSSTSLGSAGVYLGNTRALVACSKS